MYTEEAYNLVHRTSPASLYLGGKTSTGKSTFARKLQNDFGYQIIQLDQVVRQSVIEPLGLKDDGQVFVEVYRERTQTGWIDRFKAAARQAITKAGSSGQRLIIEGAVANPLTLKEILDAAPDIVFFYFHPKSLAAYKRNLTSRLLEANEDNGAGLPARFWKLIDKPAFKQFCRDRQLTPALTQAIHAYAKHSQAESTTRLATFRNQFDNIIVIEV